MSSFFRKTAKPASVMSPAPLMLTSYAEAPALDVDSFTKGMEFLTRTFPLVKKYPVRDEFINSSKLPPNLTRLLFLSLTYHQGEPIIGQSLYVRATAFWRLAEEGKLTAWSYPAEGGLVTVHPAALSVAASHPILADGSFDFAAFSTAVQSAIDAQDDAANSVLTADEREPLAQAA